MPAAIKWAYARIGRYLRKCRVKIYHREGKVVITLFPEVVGTTARVRGELSVSELRTLLNTKGIRELEIKAGDHVSTTKYCLRRGRRDLTGLFPDDIKGNVAELLINVRGGPSLSLIMFEKDAVRLERFLKDRRSG